MKLSIRKIQHKDIEALSQLATDSFVHAYKITLPEEALLQYSQTAFSPSALQRIMENSKAIYLVAENKEGIVGYTHFEILEPPAPLLSSSQSPIEMVRLYTKVGFEAQGIGSHLLREAISLCREANHDYIWLQVWEGNKKAQHFYKSHGFEPLGSQPYVDKCLSRTVIIMGKAIKT